MEITCPICSYPAIFVQSVNLADIDSSYPDYEILVYKCIHCGYYSVQWFVHDENDNSIDILTQYPDLLDKLNTYMNNLTS